MSLEAMKKPMAATPHKQLIDELMDSRIPKSEREHAAAREIEKLRKVIEAAEKQEPVAWYPIATAPAETEVFIGAYIDGEWKFGRSVLFYEQANEFAGETFSGWVWAVDDCDTSVTEEPTHWMPLPPPPIEAKLREKNNAR